MRGLPFWVVAVVAASLLLTFVPVARGAAATPAWSKGDFWAYSGTALSPWPGLVGSGTIRFDVLGTEPVSVGGSTVAAYRTAAIAVLDVWTGSGYASTTVRYTDWFRGSDLAELRIFRSVADGSDTVNLTVTWDPPIAIPWPVETNATWSVTSTMTKITTLNGQVIESVTGSATKNSTVRAGERITVPAGSFDAVPIEESVPSQTGYHRVFWSAAVGNIVAVHAGSPGTSEQTMIELTSYAHQQASSPVPPPGDTPVSGIAPTVVVGVTAVGVAAVAAVLLLRRRRP